MEQTEKQLLSWLLGPCAAPAGPDMAPAMGQTAQVYVAILRVDMEPGLDRTKESPVPWLGTFVAGCGASAFRFLSSAFDPS